MNCKKKFSSILRLRASFKLKVFSCCILCTVNADYLSFPKLVLSFVVNILPLISRIIFLFTVSTSIAGSQFTGDLYSTPKYLVYRGTSYLFVLILTTCKSGTSN